MSMTGKLALLHDLHTSGGATEEEGPAAEAKAPVAENTSPAPVQDDGLRQEVQRLGLQQQILQLDLDWERERQTYMLRGRSGASYPPAQGGTLFGAIGFAVMGLFLLALSFDTAHSGPPPFVGLMIIVVGIAIGVSGAARESAYQKAEADYQRRRDELTDQSDRI